MIKLYDNGVYLLNGTEILEDKGNVSLPVSKKRLQRIRLPMESGQS